ncbi:MAG: type II secretion system protein [Lachnospiraceae bacterium]|nr:type II secretion system protein [Lachnospiraceae bacterium]
MFGFKLRKDNRGLSLVELICAIAILGIITATVGGAMVVATHSYRQSTVETSLQQEAQFTANTIEALIIDATTEVNWDASTGVLEIKNDGIGSYRIVYDGAARELRYTEYAADGTPVEPQNELLAAHVSNFMVDATNFSTTRNVVLTIEMEHEGSKYVTAYNVTSRNNPSNEVGPEASATITVPAFIVLEPNESYTLSVVVSGASTAYNCSITDSDAGPLGIQTTAAVVPGGIQLDAGAAETGGADQDLQLNIWTTAVNAAGDSLASKVVHVHIRRVTDLTIKELGVTGERGKKDAVYTISVPRENYAGIYLDQIVTAINDGTNYVDPHTLKWEVCPGASSLVELVDPSAVYNEVIQFKLKDDLPTGTTNVVQAVSLHSKGTEGTPKNKTGLPYNELVVKPFSITVSEDSEADIQRGRVAYLYPQGAGKNAADWVHEMTGDDVTNVNALRFYYRYRTDDWVHTTTGYSEGTWMSNTEGGKHGGADFFKFRPADFSPVYYAKQYNLQVLMAVEYDAGGVRKWYPADIQSAVNANGGSFPGTLTNYHVSEDISDASDYIKKYTIPPMSMKFTEVYTPAWTEEIWWPERKSIAHPASTLNIDSYLTDSHEGLGSISNPIPMYKSSPWYFKAEMLADYVSDDLGVRSLVKRAKYYDVTDAANPILLSGAEAPQMDFEDGDADGFDTTNNAIIKPVNTWNGGFQVNHKYKLVFDSFQGGFGDENYADASVAGKGEIYFTLLDGTP